jgi:anti-anti-sigma factor
MRCVEGLRPRSGASSRSHAGCGVLVRVSHSLEGSEVLDTDGRNGDFSAGARRHTLSLIGELDQRTARVLDAEIERLCEEDVAGITLDLRELTYIDSTGIAVIAVRCELCRKRGQDFALIPGSRFVNRAVERSGVSHLLPVEEDEIPIRRSRPRRSVQRETLKSLGGWLLPPSPATVQGSAEVHRGPS